MFARLAFWTFVSTSLPFLATASLAQQYVLRPDCAFVPKMPLGPKSPTVALDGYCPVTLIEEARWAKGKPKWRAEYLARTYLLASRERRATFVENPRKHAPVLSGMDVVEFAENGTNAPGKRLHGVFFKGRIFLFASEENVQTFYSAPSKYGDEYLESVQMEAAEEPKFDAAAIVRKYTFGELP